MNRLILILLSPIFLVSCSSTSSTTSTSDTTSTTSTSSSISSTLTQFGLETAGTAAAIAIINLVDKDNKSGTANDILTIDVALLSLLNGTIPTEAQVTAVMEAFKSDTSTTNYATIAQKIATQFSSFLTSWTNSGATATQITQYATWFVYGTQLGANLYAE